MRKLIVAAFGQLAFASTALAAEPAQGGGSALLSPNTGLMFWTLVIFAILYFVLRKYAFGPITEAVEKREKALEEAIANAKRDREDAAKILAEHTAQLEGARAEAQRIIAEGRAVADKLRASMLEETRAMQQEMLDRARREIETEKTKAIAELREEAVDLAIAGASKVIEKNLDDPTNRKLVESFLAGASVQKRRN
jgi:F-type H+-transporting ATPase subunit b